MGNDVEGMAERASRNRSFEWVARGGYVGSGIVHLLIAWIAGQIALGSSGEADEAGALDQLGTSPVGIVLLWMCVVGFVALALWNLVEALLPHRGPRREQLADRVKAAGKGVLYGALAFTAVKVVTGVGADSGEASSEATSTLMAAPAGRILVGALGLVVLGVGGYHVYKGAKRTFREDLRGTSKREISRAVTVLGIVGYVAKGAALAVMGGLFVTAAVKADPEQPTGLDAALKALRDQPFGELLLLVVAIGLAAYGLYSFARARYATM